MHRLTTFIALFLAIFTISVSAQYATTTWQGQVLKAHNVARSLKKVPALKWSANLERLACKCASTNAAKGNMNHCRVGENLWSASKSYSTAVAGISAANTWINERKSYGGQAIGGLSGLVKYGHYTQVMWKKSKNVGCCMKKGNKNIVVVCNYDPPGNYKGQKPY
ncbi:hypothetical protein HK097_007398 [Rhizophlyctis rosea]|uniref:SCP domain-containing protein n=1 Tax=Rhizophlyctis rosea TaxID=64517 RepID=A0AAD5X9I1_9FUNG|nr:hypothetical protein HK097_007398 [Rhizophlyctis rosea]